jgi:regulator of protease activity HflC (stomatin/prohibitin superfamily)
VGAVENRVLGEGIHFIIPFAEQVVPLEVRTLKFQADASAASNDLQEVQTTIALNYHISPSQPNIIYQQLGADYADRIIAPTIQESVKASVAKFNAEELITKRATAKAVIAQSIANTLGARDIVVETVFITDFKFSQAFASQVESKVVAFQKFLTEQNNLKAIQVIANQTVVQAQAAARANVAKANGESQAIKIITVQLKESDVSSVAINQQVERTNALCSWEWRSSFFPTATKAAITKSKSNSKPNAIEITGQ